MPYAAGMSRRALPPHPATIVPQATRRPHPATAIQRSTQPPHSAAVALPGSRSPWRASPPRRESPRLLPAERPPVAVQRSIRSKFDKSLPYTCVAIGRKKSKSSILLKPNPKLAQRMLELGRAQALLAQASKDPHDRNNRILAAGDLIMYIENDCIEGYGLSETGFQRVISAIRQLVREQENNSAFYSQLNGYWFQAEVALLLSNFVVDVERRYTDYQGRDRWADLVLTNGSYVECKAYAEDYDPPLGERQRFQAQARAYARSGVDVTYVFKNGAPAWCLEILAQEFADHDINWNASIEDITHGGAPRED